MKEKLSLSGSARAQKEIKKSVFIASVFHVKDELRAKELIEGVRKEFDKANHHCYAYITGEDNQCAFSDDGEPGGTAGRPIFSVLEKNNLTDVLCVVTRYFGGIKLGAGGLVRAYSQSAAAAIDIAEKMLYIPCDLCEIKTDYSLSQKVASALEKFNIAPQNVIYAQRVIFSVLIKKEMTEKVFEKIKDYTNADCELRVCAEAYTAENYGAKESK